MRYLTLDEVIELQRLVLEQSGGGPGILDQGLLESAVDQPAMSFAGQELYPALADKAAALCFSIVMNHPFTDANKRVGHAAMEVFLFLNGFQLNAPVDEQEQIILSLAASRLSREEFSAWVTAHIVPGAGTS
jgi:death-on-curing protein